MTVYSFGCMDCGETFRTWESLFKHRQKCTARKYMDTTWRCKKGGA